MSESNVLLFGFMAVSLLLFALCIVTAVYVRQTQHHIRTLEDDAEQLRFNLRVEREASRNLAADIDFLVHRKTPKHQEPNA